MRAEQIGETAERLREVGRRLFARDGYDGTSVRALAGAAGVNLGSVRYHFGSKRGLYRVVIRSGLDPLREQLERISWQNDLPYAQLQTGLMEVVEFFRVHPDVAGLVQRAFQDLQGTSAGEPAELLTPLRPLGRMIQGAQEVGLVRSDEPCLLALRLLLVSSQILLLARAMGSGQTGVEPPTGRGSGASICAILTHLVLEPEEG